MNDANLNAKEPVCNPVDPMKKLHALCQRLNNEWVTGATGATVEPYLNDNKEARLRVSVMTFDRRTVAVGWLMPEKADGHTYYIFAQAMKSAYEDGVKEGLRLAKERLMERLIGPSIEGKLG
jgi:hypothetical protein